jgi:RNA polymerase sigma-70 factor (ECF subfamily)
LSKTSYKDPNHILIEKCKKGDRHAFREIYELYSKAMFNISMRILNKREEAEDVLQESFIKAFNSLDQYKGEASFGTWLKKIVINRSLDVVNKKQIDFIPIDRIELQDDVDETEEMYTIEDVKEALHQLPDGYRVILTLFLFENYSHKMISEHLKISEGTSKSQYHRARKKLQELIISKQLQHEKR